MTQKLSELEARMEGHDGQISEIIETLRQLMTPPPADEDLKREIGFHIKEDSVPYRVTKKPAKRA
jgi:hypothetical protein